MSGFDPNLLVLMYFLFGGLHALIEHMHMDDTHGDYGDHEWLPRRVPAAKSIKSPAEGVHFLVAAFCLFNINSSWSLFDLFGSGQTLPAQMSGRGTASSSGVQPNLHL